MRRIKNSDYKKITDSIQSANETRNELAQYSELLHQQLRRVAHDFFAEHGDKIDALEAKLDEQNQSLNNELNPLIDRLENYISSKQDKWKSDAEAIAFDDWVESFISIYDITEETIAYMSESLVDKLKTNAVLLKVPTQEPALNKG